MKKFISPEHNTQSDHMTGNNTLKEVWIIVSISGVTMLLGVSRPWGVVGGRGAREKFSKIGSNTGPSSAFSANCKGLMWTLMWISSLLNCIKI